jgi:hypothetical protein
MGIVAGVAGFGGLVAILDDLGEAGRPRHQIAVTGQAQFFPGREGRVFVGLFSCVFRCWAVAGFTAESSMERLVLGFYLIIVALRTGLPARELDFVRRVYLHRVGSIVPEFSEGFRNEALPHQDHDSDDNQEDDPNLENLIRKLSLFQSTLRVMREPPADLFGGPVGSIFDRLT